MTKELARLSERSELERADHLQLVEKLKQDIKDRYTQELSQKSHDATRTEALLGERINLLEKEVSKLEIQLLQSKQTETELRDKGETMRQKCDSLQLELFKANDFERKSGIELQIKVNQLQQELDLKDQHYSRQVTELKQELQEATLSRDKVSLELA